MAQPNYTQLADAFAAASTIPECALLRSIPAISDTLLNYKIKLLFWMIIWPK